MLRSYFFFFFFNDTATTEIYTLSLHDALPISARGDDTGGARDTMQAQSQREPPVQARTNRDPKVGDSAIARDLVGDRLLRPAQGDRVMDDDAERTVEIGGEAATHHDAGGHRSG